MKQLFTILCLAISFFQLNGQCEQAITIENGVRNNTATTLTQLSEWDSEEELYLNNDLVAKVNSQRSLWIGGKDELDNLHLAAGMWTGNGRQDFYPGILEEGTGQMLIQDYCQDHKKIWSFKGEYIQRLKVAFQLGILSNDDLNEDMLSYPAKGNVWYEDTFGVKIESDAGPFYDQDNDGIYNPLEGDYPICLEENPDFMPHEFSFTIVNDADFHALTQGSPLYIQIHQTNYLLKDVSNPLLEQTVFSRYKIVNKGSMNFQDLYLGLSRCTNEDGFEEYLGCDTLLNLDYVYPHGESTPGIIPSTMAHLNLYLNKKMSSYSYTGNTSGNTNEIFTAYPYYNQLRGFWNDGTPFSVGGFGTEDDPEETTKFLFPDCPSGPDAWTMINIEDISPSYSISAFEIGDFPIGASIYFDIADIMVYDPQTSIADKLCNLDGVVDEVMTAYDQMTDFFSSTEVVIMEENKSLVYPNPTTGQLYIELKTPARYIELLSLDGASFLHIESTNQIDMSEFPTGLYLVQIATEAGIETHKILKQ